MRRLILFLLSASALPAQIAQPNEAGASIAFVQIIVSDPDAHRKLWMDVLGAQSIHAGSLEMLKLPGAFVIVTKARTVPTGGSDGSTVNHFGFLVKSYADTKAKLTAAGITSYPVDRPGTQFIAEFPENVRVEFTQDPALKTPIAFHHLHLATTDEESLRAWYVKTFGAKPGKRGDFLAAFIPGGEVDFRKADTAPAPTKGRSLDHIGFEIRGLEAFCKNLQAQGVTFDSPYREIPQLGGLKIAIILDPIGTRIELTEGLSAL